MGSATTQALDAITAALDGASGVDLDVAGELFAAARAVGGSPHLGGALADSAAMPAARTKVVTDVFGAALKPVTVSLLSTVAQQRWSSASDLIDGIEELAVRAAAAASTDEVEAELFAFSRTVADNGELELALGTRLGQPSAKGALVERVLGADASPATVLIAASLAQQPRERRMRTLLARAIRLVSNQRDRTVATVVAAAPLSATQTQRLASALSARYGGEISLNVMIDPAVVGGLRVQIADDVIDASVATRLADLRHRLAG